MQIRNLQFHEADNGRRWESAEIVNNDMVHTVDSRWGSWQEVLEDGRRRFVHFDLAVKLQREVKQRVKREEKMP